ncbi:MAG: YIP1 family protein [Terracidiphilus sp.]
MSDIEVHSAAEPTVGLSQWQRVSNTFAAPSMTFDDIKRGNKSWWMPLLILAVVGYIFFAVIYSMIGMQQVVDNQVRLDPKATERMAQATPEQREMGAKISLYITEGIFIASPLMLMLIAAIVSVVLMGTINFVLGGKATFGSAYAVWFYGMLPSIVKSLLGIVVILSGMAPESFNIKNFAPTNLGAFLDPVETNKALYALATSMDAITIWSLVLMSMGIATVAGVKRGSGYIAVFGWWAIIVLLGVGVAAIRG